MDYMFNGKLLSKMKKSELREEIPKLVTANDNLSKELYELRWERLFSTIKLRKLSFIKRWFLKKVMQEVGIKFNSQDK